MDAATRQQLERGKRLIEILKQDQFNPLRISQQIAIVYAAIHGHLDDVELSKVQEFEKELYSLLNSQHSDLLDKIESEKELTDEIVTQFEGIIAEVRKLFVEV